MALKISDSRSFKLEPMRKNRWVFQFSAIPGNDSHQTEALAFVCKTCTAPSFTFADSSMARMNETFKSAGLVSYNDISCSFYDIIRNKDAANAELSASDILYNWVSVIYNPLTGQMGYKTQYATSATLAQLDPAGSIIRSWNLFGIYPSSVTFGDGLDQSSGDICEITATFKYDLAIKCSDAKNPSESA